MVISDTDYDLLNKRLESIERSLEMLKTMFPIPENVSFGSLVEVDKQGNEYYVLKEGNLMDAGIEQEWRINDETN